MHKMLFHARERRSAVYLWSDAYFIYVFSAEIYSANASLPLSVM